MKNVRLLYKKGGALRFVSHLDMNRFMIRLLRLSGLPIWYTEGFNKHPYITFALPLSLGFFGEWEAVDFRLTDYEFPLSKAKEMITAVCPSGMEVIDLVEPTYKAGKIVSAEFCIAFARDSGATLLSLKEFLEQKEILVSKKTKKGEITEFNVAEKILEITLEEKNAQVFANIKLPAGGSDNINPKIIINAYFEKIGSQNPFCSITRKMLYVADGNIFK